MIPRFSGILSETKKDLIEIRDFFKWFFKNVNVWEKHRMAVKMMKDLEESGINVEYYDFFDWCSRKKGFYVKESELPKRINWFTIIYSKRLKRRPKRKVIQTVIGSSLNDRRNNSILRRGGLVTLLKNKIKKLK